MHAYVCVCVRGACHVARIYETLISFMCLENYAVLDWLRLQAMCLIENCAPIYSTRAAGSTTATTTHIHAYTHGSPSSPLPFLCSHCPQNKMNCSPSIHSSQPHADWNFYLVKNVYIYVMYRYAVK